MSEPKKLLSFDIKNAVKTSNRPVVFIHGFLSNGATDWLRDKWVTPLNKAGRSVIRVDLPAHGNGGDVDAPDQASVSALLALLAKELAPFGQVDVVGYSLGARLAWSFAAQYPEQVGQLVLGGLSPMDPLAMIDIRAARQLLADGTEPQDPITKMIGGMIAQAGDKSPSLLNLVEGLASEPFSPQSKAPKCKSLVVAGAQDDMAGNVDAIVPHLSDAQSTLVPGDHFSALQSNQFRQEVFSFLGIEI